MRQKKNLKDLLGTEEFFKEARERITSREATEEMIKEVWNLAVDTCLKEAKAYNEGSEGNDAFVNEDSILQVKQMIDYE